MPLSLYLGFVLATTVLMLIPGPNVALIVANSLSHGTRYGLLTVAGTSAAMVVQLALTVAGMTATLSLAAGVFGWLRWVGVAYLLYLGIRQWRAPPPVLPGAAPARIRARAILLRGLMVSATNPKTLLFYGAFFPQFVVPGPHLGAQLLLLAGTFLALALLLDGLWAVAAGRARGVLVWRGRLANRLAGGALISAGVGLALARR